jgi:hypothetical protein
MADEDTGISVYIILLIALIGVTITSVYVVSSYLTNLAHQETLVQQCNGCLSIWAVGNSTEFCSNNCVCTIVRKPFYIIKLTDPNELNISEEDFARICYNNTSNSDVSCQIIDNETGNITITRQKLHLIYDRVPEECVNVTVQVKVP